MAASTPPGDTTSQSAAPKDDFLAPSKAPKGGGGGGSKTLIGVIILVVVMVIAGAGTYFALGGFAPATSTTTTSGTDCHSNAGGCKQSVTYHDASIFSPFTSASALSPVSFTATILTGVIETSTFYFGDGTTTVVQGTNANVQHTYTGPGSYYVFVSIKDTSGNTHDNLNKVIPFKVGPSFEQVQAGTIAILSGANVTSDNVKAGGTVTLQGVVQSPPSQAGWAVSKVGFVSTNGTAVSLSSPSSFSGNTSSAQVTATVGSTAANGVYSVVFYANSTNGVTTANSTFTMAIGVGVVVQPLPIAKSPHPGTMDVYYLVPGGSFSEDPGVDYETAGYEPIVNVFQTLISYNGSLAGPYPTDYVPNLATCVPGSSLCTQLYGNTLQSGDNYTFVINPNAEFYNPSTKSSANVFPMDVLFSYVRTCMFADFPYGNPGWIQCQSLLPYGSSSYDSGLHYPYNSTPTNILNAIQINNSAFCPSSATNGCVTFDTQYSGNYWPDFLEFVADPLGGGILDCNYAMSVGMSSAMPGFSCGSHTDPTGIGDTAWDGVSLGMGSAGSDYSGTSGQPVANWANTLRWSMVGSGPYYLASLTPGTSYTVMTNPDWKGTTCSWSGCLPTTFPVNTVNVVWEASATQGEAALENGQADIATVPPTDFSSVLLPLLHGGKVGITSAPGLSVFFTNFDMSFNPVAAQSYLPAGTTLNAPATLFQDLAFRQFLVHAFPYATVQSQYNTVDGIPLYQLYGGAIPIGMGNYYPNNISWDMSDPGSGASPWWAAVQSENGIAAKACLPSKPCVFPFLSYAGAPLQDEVNGAWVTEITKLSGGAVDAVPVDIPFINLVINSFAAPGQNPMPMYELGWAPDYPDPTDYVNPIYMPDSTYTYGDALCEGLGMFTTMGCAPHTSNLAAGNYDGALPAGWVWTNATVTTATQGTAYTTMTTLLADAAFDTNLQQRALLYNAAEHIAQQLGIFVPNSGQAIAGWTTASWIVGSSMNLNPTIGGGGDSTWYTVQYVAS